MAGGVSAVSKFTEQQMAYLESLPAVDRVTSSRIYYAPEFRDECMRRYRAGEKPLVLFREAGLYPQLIGHKRIERAFARWREMSGTCAKPKRKYSLKPSYGVTDMRDDIIRQQSLLIRMLEDEIVRLKDSLGAHDEK
ncbi:hypothetical protein [Bifidobacterium eulemuris]|nr:hypothetical protein [Bifidobacterium eulemuris]QOL31218.1 hypothetical protein BE0216_01150 [Bifidobacterium eulemuris]